MPGKNFWENDPVVTQQPTQQRQPPRPIVAVGQTPDQQHDNAVQDQGAANDATRTGIAVEGNERSKQGQSFDQVTTYRKEYNALPDVQKYKTALQQLDIVLHTSPNGAGDQDLIYALAQLRDPLGSVREGDVALTQSGQNLYQQTVATLNKQLSDAGGEFTPEFRDKLRQESIQRLQAYRRAYDTARQRYGEYAQADGFDPYKVIGEDDGHSFYQRFQNYDRQRAGLPPLGSDGKPAPGGSGPIDPKMVGGVPQGSQIQFGMDGGDAPFDRAKYIQDTYGITPDQESLIVSFWNANSGNPNMTVDGVLKWYQDKGLTPPSPEGVAKMIAVAQKTAPGTSWAGFDTSQAEEAYRKQLQGVIDARGVDPTNPAAAAVDHAASGATFGLLDEIDGVGGGISALFGNRPVLDGYRQSRDATRLQLEQGSDANPVISGVSEFAGGLAIPVRGASGAKSIGQFAREGAAMGALAGYGYGEGAQDSLTGATLGGLGGAALGAGAGKFAEALGARQAARTGNTAADNYAAGQKFGLDLSLGDAGGRGAKMFERSLDAQPASAEALNIARRNLGGQLETAVDNVADTFGPATSFRGMGEAAQQGARNWIDRFQAAVGKAYDAIPIKPDVPATLGATRQALADLTSKISSNELLAPLLTNPKFSAYLEALTGKTTSIPTGIVDVSGKPILRQMQQGGALSWNDLKTFRSTIGEQIGDHLFSDGSLKSELRQLYGALSTDMEASAVAQGPGALRAFQRANSMFKAGQDRMDGVITRLLGNDGKSTPEAAAAFLQRIAKDGKGSADLSALAEVRKTLRPEEWDQVSNAFIRLLGQPANSAGREFSPASFIRSYVDMEPAAKNLLFGGEGKALRQNLEEFAGVIGRMAENDSTRNVSGTAYGMGNMLTTGAGAMLGSSIPIPIVGPLMGILLGQSAVHGAGKLWTSPTFIRWATGYSKMLAGAAKNGGQIPQKTFDGQMSALGRVASSQSAIAADALGLQRQLIDAFGQIGAGAPQRLAADPSGATSYTENPTKEGAQR